MAKKEGMMKKKKVAEGQDKKRNLKSKSGKKAMTTAKNKKIEDKKREKGDKVEKKDEKKVKKKVEKADNEKKHELINPELQKQHPEPSESLSNAVKLAVFGSSFQYGYNAVALKTPSKEILDSFFPCNLTSHHYNATCEDENETYRSNMMLLANAAYPLAGIFGSLLIGLLVTKAGRRNSLLLNNILSFLAAGCLSLSYVFNHFFIFIIGRLVIGLFAGLASGLVPIYICELAPIELRGRLGVLHQLFIAIGMLSAYIFGLTTMLGDHETWPYCLLLTCVPSLFQCLLFTRIKESPWYLFIDKHDEKAAMEVLEKLRDRDYVLRAEIEELEREAEHKTLTFKQLIKDKSFRFQLYTVTLLMAGRQLTGIHAVLYYKYRIFRAAGIPAGHQQEIGIVCVGIIHLCIIILCYFIVEKVGRRRLLLYGFGCQTFWCLIITIFLSSMLSYDYWQMPSYLPYLSVLGTTSFLVAWSLGPGPLAWVVTSELFTYSARPYGVTIACFVNWFAYFISITSFTFIVEMIGGFIFIPFMIISACIFIYLKIVMEDTSHKTFTQIKSDFAERNRVAPDEEKPAKKKKTGLQKGKKEGKNKKVKPTNKKPPQNKKPKK